MLEVREYIHNNKRAPFTVWLDALDRKARARIDARIERTSNGLSGIGIFTGVTNLEPVVKSRNYLDVRKERLKDPREAAAYLEAALNYESEAGFMLALRTVAEVYGIANVARDTGLGRESLYKTLREGGNPKLRTLKAVLDTLGIRIVFAPNETPSSRAHAVEAREPGVKPYGRSTRSTPGRAATTAAARGGAGTRRGGRARGSAKTGRAKTGRSD